jgi:hypothetical protein
MFGAFERSIYAAKKLFLTAWSVNDRGNSAGLGEGSCLTAQILAGHKNDGGLADNGVSAQLADELVAIHRWHEHVTDDEVWSLKARQLQRLCAIGSLLREMVMETQEFYQQLTIEETIIND